MSPAEWGGIVRRSDSYKAAYDPMTAVCAPLARRAARARRKAKA